VAYDPDTPANSAEDPSQSQPKITSNFQALNTSNSVNHVAYNDADQGKHKFMQMPEQASAPSTAANEGALYTAVEATSTVSELVYRREGNGAAIAFTETAGSADSGWTRLPSGLILGWQIDSFSTGATVTMLGMTTIYQVTGTVDNSVDPAAQFISVYSLNDPVGGTFNVRTSAGGAAIRFIAIGV